MRNKDTIARILIADSNSLFREKIKQIIADNFDFTLTSETFSAEDVLNELSEYAFDVLILDTELSGGNGLNVLKKIKTVTPGIPVLIMSMFPVEQYEESIFRAGAHGYVSKVNLSNELVTALQKVFGGKKYFSSQCIGNASEKSYDQRDSSNSRIEKGGKHGGRTGCNGGSRGTQRSAGPNYL